jgi:hypothetical protein
LSKLSGTGSSPAYTRRSKLSVTFCATAEAKTVAEYVSSLFCKNLRVLQRRNCDPVGVLLPRLSAYGRSRRSHIRAGPKLSCNLRIDPLRRTGAGFKRAGAFGKAKAS